MVSQAVSLFPEILRDLNRCDSRKRIYTMHDGKKVYIQSSKLHDNRTYHATWNSMKWNLLDEVEFYCLVVRGIGAFLIPMSVMKEYSKVAPSVNSDQFHIQIKLEPNLEFIVARDKKFNLNPGEFVRFINNTADAIIDNINQESIDTTLALAKNFKDLEFGYKDSQELIHRRIESKAQKERIAKLENHTCQVCGFRYEYKNSQGNSRWIIEVDHIKEKCNGGGETIDNMLVLCPNCHAKKTYGAIKINSDYTYSEKGVCHKLKYNNHLGID